MNHLAQILLRLIFSPFWITLINFGLTAFISYQAVQLWYSLTEPALPNLPTLSSHASTLSRDSPISSTPDLMITHLLQAQLFGAPKPTTVSPSSPTPVAIAKLPLTPLNLTLHGIYYHSAPQKSLAIIATEDQKTALYKLGETLPNGAIIDKIEPKQLTLLRNGRPEMLYLLRSNPTTTETTASSSPNPATDNDLSSGKLLSQYQQQLQTNPQSLMNLMRLSPVNQEGRFIGYRIKPGTADHLFSAFKLQTGDILTAVNEIKLDSPLKALTVIEQLASADHLELQILRDGQLLPLSFAVEK